MSIKLRLVLSNLAMILVPIIFVCLSAVLVALLFKTDVKELRAIYLPPEHYKKISDKNQFFIDLHKETLKNPGLFMDPAYLENLDSQLNQKADTSLIVRKSKHIIYLPEKLKDLDKSELPPFGLFREIEPVEQVNHQFVSIKKLDFYYPDGSEGSLFFVKDASGVTKFVRTFFPILFTLLILVLIGTNGLLTYYVSKSIIRPIRGMQKAAQRMKEGDLSIPIPVYSKDEIGQLALGVEEMRVRLKESIETQLAYEENRKELIANISHDLRTPITTIKGYMEGIRDGVANSPEKMDRYMQTILSKANELDRMIEELFLYSKLDLQRLPFHFEKIHFDHYLEDFVEELRFDVEGKRVDINLNIEKSGDYQVIGDRENLKRVITNIVDNSLKYIDKPDKVLSFHLSTNDSYVLFKMTDNGPGIPKESLSLIFDRFYRADSARGTDKGGSGLGLSIAKRIIEEHQGSIWAESQEEHGTTILFTLKKAGVE
ncbi:sensor histidine kinase [Neobacillus citreus]|uniref:histidine kinase n=1 Tax=Neobacillus citreus TaxID=2833578 RepID=A0A942YEU2_9BACI|nr:ATP-binding protein [Neobacillus citreus]MCH6266092.1 cell wall metabolism sensor histidine kinase WalK [Neobacillus citreus]